MGKANYSNYKVSTNDLVHSLHNITQEFLNMYPFFKEQARNISSHHQFSMPIRYCTHHINNLFYDSYTTIKHIY